MIITDRIAGLNQGVALKAPCRTVTTAPIQLYGLQTINGILLETGDRVLVKDQTDPRENGIWNANSTAWARAKDFDGPRDAVKGTLVYAGAPNDGVFYSLQANDPVMITADDLIFIPFLFADPADIAALLALSSAITLLAGISEDIVTVSGVSDDVTTVAGIAAAVEAVSAALEDIQTAAENIVAIQNAEQNALDAEAARELAEKWATEAEDVEVVPGQYSSYHWAQKALEAVIGSIGASSIIYSNTSSGLIATNVQAAIDEVVGNIQSLAGGLGSMASEDAGDYTKTGDLGGLAFLSILNESDMASNSETRPPSQKSVVDYIDSKISALEVLWVAHEVASGTNGGSTTSASWNTRALNTVKKNTIAGASLSSNVITLPPGDYRISGGLSAYSTAEVSVRVRDVTNNITLFNGVKFRATSSATDAVPLDGFFTLAATTNIQIQMYTSSSSTNGQGLAYSTGENEMYASIVIEKLS